MTPDKLHGEEEIGSNQIDPLLPLKVTIAPNEQLSFAKLDHMDVYGAFWNVISLNSKVSTDLVELAVGDVFQLDLDLSFFKPDADSTLILSYLALLFSFEGQEVANPPLQLQSSSITYNSENIIGPMASRMPIITSEMDITESVVSFEFLTLQPPDNKTRTYHFTISGSLAVTPKNDTNPPYTIGRHLPFSFDPQLRIVTG